VIAAILAAIGCGCSGDPIQDSARVARCHRVCDASKKCGSSGSNATAVDCYSLCDDIDAVNSATNCYARFDDLYDCIEKHGACGEAETACTSQSEAYDDCIAENCSRDPDRDDCGL